MGPLTELIPVPRPCTLAGVPVLVSEARLRDLAELQAILDGTVPDPLAGMGGAATGDGDPEHRRRALVAAYRLAEAGPPVYGEAGGTAYFATPEGHCMWLVVVLRRHQPELTAADVVRMASEQLAGEYDRIYRVFHGIQPLKAIERLLFADAPSRAPGGASITWSEAIDEVSRERGWSYEQIYGLSLSEWRNVRRNGRPEPRGRVVPRGTDLLAALAEMRRVFGRGDDDATGYGTTRIEHGTEGA